MTPTHQIQGGGEDVVAWRYLPESTTPIPLWIARNFHNVGNNCLTHTNGFVVKPGEWIFRPLDRPVCKVLTDEEFNRVFIQLHPLPLRK